MTHIHHGRGARRLRRGAAALGACALLGATLPLGAAAQAADDAPAGPGFSGFSSSTVAAPVKIEIFEPTIPIPASPQAELSLGYSKVLADSSGSKGRASFLWPGDAVGEGLKTILEQLGLPQALIGPIAAQGYPVQVNSGFPSGDAEQTNERLPGSVMRTKATQYTTFAKTGFSTDCDVQDPTGSDAAPAGGSGGSGSGDSGSGGSSPLDGLTSLVGGLFGPTTPSQGDAQGGTGDGKDDGKDTTACQLPAQLAALVDLGGYVASSQTTSSTGVGAQVKAISRASLGDISLLGGLVTLSGLTSTAVTTGDGGKPVAGGHASYGILTIAGQRFRIGPDGLEAAGQQQRIPGLPSAPAALLKALGLTLETPGRVETRTGGKLTATTEALRLTIDTAVLQPLLKLLPLSTILNPIANSLPTQAGPLKSLLLSIPELAPKIVLHIGYATSTLETVQGVDIPGVDPGAGGGTGTAAGGGTTGGLGATGGPTAGGGTGSTDVPATSDPGATAGGGESATTGDLPPTTQAAGLPKLFSIPGLLMAGALVGAFVIGSLVRRLGLAALGGGAACAHGLESGVPDLRRA